MSPVETLRRAGPYSLSEMLAYNGLAATYKGVLASNQQPVIVVTMPSEDLVKPGSWEDFQRQAEVLTRTPAANVARLLGHGVEDDVVWAAYEFLRGHHVGEIVQDTGLPTPTQALSVMAFAADALVQMQHVRLCHGALSPASLFLTDMSEFRLLHAGWAGLLHGTGGGLVHPSLMSLLPFAAPEIAAGNPPDAASDVYSLGANLYFLLTGLPTHWAEDPQQLARMIQEDTIDLAPVRAVSPDAAELIEELFEKDPLDRPVNLSALRDRLAAISGSQPGAAGPETASPSIPAGSAYNVADPLQPPKMSLEELGAITSAAKSSPSAAAEEMMASPPASPAKPITAAIEHAVASAARKAVAAEEPPVPRALASGAPSASPSPPVSPPTETKPFKPQQSSGGRSRVLLLALLGVVVLVGAGAGVYFLMPDLFKKTGEPVAIAPRAPRQPAQPVDTRDRLGETRTALEAYAPLLLEYLRLNGVWPRNFDTLSASVTIPEELLIDAWDTPFDVRRDFVVSAGPDGQWDTADDMWIKVDRTGFELGGRTGL